MPEFTIGKPAEFSEDHGTKVELPNGIDVAVFKIDDEFYAIANNCPHKNLPLHDAGKEAENSDRLKGRRLGGINVEDCSIYCPWHRLEWDLESGENDVTNMQISTFDVTVEDGDVVLTV
jgi:nitrite reductase (NADH) small subunit